MAWWSPRRPSSGMLGSDISATTLSKLYFLHFPLLALAYMITRAMPVALASTYVFLLPVQIRLPVEPSSSSIVICGHLR
jgi:hypothetical protein